MTISGRAVIVGAYEAPIREAPETHPFELLADAVGHALADAGLELADVDGLATASGDFGEGGAAEQVIEVAEYLGIEPTYVDGTDIGGCSFIAHAGHAAAAIAAGMAEVVVIAYAATPRWWPVPFPSLDAPILGAGPGQYELPYKSSLVAHFAQFAQRHMHEFGTTPEQLAEVAVTCRAHAGPNRSARYREPITVEDVLDSPLIASPLHRLDCCVLTDGAGAFVVTSEERGRDTPKRPIKIAGFGQAVSAMQLSQMPSLTATPGVASGKRAFEMAGLTPADVDVAELYDAFTITPILALEDLGFCAKGEGGPFVADGGIGADGAVPINTDGGGLSSNQPGKRGVFLMVEAVRQLRGESPGMQLRDPEVALVHGLGGFLSATATILLTI
ncbi:MAG: hypothetical protein JSS68_12680 [Actinobacteria bacterium]|nr:hypothetical protein [Actinomycetota bacterium]